MYNKTDVVDMLTNQIPTFYQLLDRCDQVLDQDSGLMGVVDFYTSRSQDSKERVRASSSNFKCSAQSSSLALASHSSKSGSADVRRSVPKAKTCPFSRNGSGKSGLRWTASTFTHPDEVSKVLDIQLTVDYLEYKMGTIKTYNGRNNFLNTYFISIPYYVFLGCSRRRDVSTNTKAFHEDAGSSVGINQGGLLTPVSPFMKVENPSHTAEAPEFFSLGPSMLESKGLEQTIVDMGAPLSPFHYQLRKVSLAIVTAELMPELASPVSRIQSPRAV